MYVSAVHWPFADGSRNSNGTQSMSVVRVSQQDGTGVRTFQQQVMFATTNGRAACTRRFWALLTLRAKDEVNHHTTGYCRTVNDCKGRVTQRLLFRKWWYTLLHVTIATPLTCNGGKLSKIKHWAGVRPLEKKNKDWHKSLLCVLRDVCWKKGLLLVEHVALPAASR